jgi:hypothetical protein
VRWTFFGRFVPWVQHGFGRFLGVLPHGCAVRWTFFGRFVSWAPCGLGRVLGVLGCQVGWQGVEWLGVCVGSRRQGWPPRWSGGGGTARSVEAGGAGFEVGPGVGAGPGLVHVCLHRTHSPMMRRGSAALWTFFGCFVSWARCDVGRVLGIWGCRVGWRGGGGLALAWAAGRRGWPPRGHENIAI